MNQVFNVERWSESNFKVISDVVVERADLGYFALKGRENNQNVIKI